MAISEAEYQSILSRLDRSEAEVANMKQMAVSFQPLLWIPPVTTAGDIFDSSISYYGGLFNRILRFSTARTKIVQYPGTAAGMTTAIAAAETDDVYWMPNRTIAGDYTLPANTDWIGIHRHRAILTGQITLSDDTAIINLSLNRTADDANDLKGVIAPSSGGGYIIACRISVTQAGAGDAYAVSVESDGDVETMETHLLATSGSGSGYAVYHAEGGAIGNSYQYGGRGYGNTDYTNVNV